MSNTPIAQIAVSTIKGTEKQNIYPKTIDRAVLTTDKEGNEDTLDNVLIKGIDINGETVTPDENGVVSVPIATDSQSGFMTAEQAKYIDDLREYTDGLREDIPNLQNKLDAAYGEINIDNIDSLCTADDMLQGKPACYTVLYTLTTSKGTVTVKVGVLWVYSDNLRHVVMQVLNTNFVPDDDGTFSSHTHNHDMHEYSRIYCYDSNAASHAGVAVKTWTKWQEVGGKGIVDRITNVALAKQNKLTAGDDATRLNGAKLSTKQIFTGSIDTIAGAVPMLLPAGGCIYNSADKKLYIGDSNSQPVEVAKPNDFLFFSNGKLYHYQFGNFGEVETGTTLVAGDGATRINASALSTKQIYRGTVININGVPVALPVGAYCFNIATKKLYVGDSNSHQPVEVAKPDDFLFIDTASGTTYRCDGTTLHNIANIKTEELQNKLDKASIVQTTGTATDKVMSQKSVTETLDYYATSVDLRNSTQVITDTSKATSSNVLYLVADSSKNVSGVVYNSKTYTFAAEKGEKGDKGDTGATGVGITSVKQTVASMISGDTNVVEITTSDGKTSQVKIRNGNASTSGTEIVQTPGTATDKVMSQKGVNDYVGDKLKDSIMSHSSFGSGFCYKLNARQIELLEASDVITLEICGQINGGLNRYNNTSGMQYFGIRFGQHARFSTTNDGAYVWTGDAKLHPINGTGWDMAVKQDGVEPIMPIDRVLMTINRKTGTCRIYDKCSRKILECQRDAYKSDTWLGGDDYLVVGSNDNPSDIWAIRIYDRDVEPMKYNGNIVVADNNFVEAILPFQHPSNAHEISLQDFSRVYNKSVYAYAPYSWPKTRAFDTDGYLTGTNDTADWISVGCLETSVYGYQSTDMLAVDFEVTGGNWRYHGRGHVVSCIKSDGTDTGIAGYYEMTQTSAEMPAGRYTMRLFAGIPWNFADIAVGATVKIYSVKREAFHCVANINPRYFCNGQCWDDARKEWWTPRQVNNRDKAVVPTFTDAAWRAVPPSLLSQPSFNGQIKVDDSGKVYVGVVVGATRTWKQINNT